jgi:hypothetical protein
MVAYKFCEVSQVLKYTRVGDNYTQHDSLINDHIIPNATVAIQNYCRRDFVSQAFTEYLATPESKAPVKIYLKETNIALSPTPVFKLYYGFPASWDGVAALDAQYYDLNREKGILTLLVDTEHHGRSLQASYTAGYTVSSDDNATVNVPNEIRDACALQSAFLFERIINQEVGLQEKRSGDSKAMITSSAVYGLVPQARVLLNAHRKQLVGGY